MNIEGIAVTPASSPPPLEALDLTNIRCGLSPTYLELMAQIFLDSAARLRANGYKGGEGRA